MGLGSLAACAAPAPEPVATVEGELASVRLTEADDGRTVLLPVGTSFAVDLPAYPSTGYEWALVETTDALGAPFRTRFFVDAEARALAAAENGGEPPDDTSLGGRMRFYFRITDAMVGAHPLAFSYSSRTSAGAPLRAVRYVLDVRRPGQAPDAGESDASTGPASPDASAPDGTPSPLPVEPPRLGLRVERDADRLGRAWSEPRPALLVPLDRALVRLEVDGLTHRIDRSVFALVPARRPYVPTAVTASPTLAVLAVESGAARAVAREYDGHWDDALFARITSEARVFRRTRWVDELVHRYVFERDVCEKHGSEAARFLETELVKELFFLGKELLEEHVRASVLEDEDPLVAKARTFVAEHLFEPFTMAELARACHASESTLLRAFRRGTGETPAAYLRNRRLDEAFQLLKSGRYTASEVALRVGYGQLSAFTAAFRRRFEVPPSDVRRAPPKTAPPAGAGAGAVPRRRRAGS